MDEPTKSFWWKIWGRPRRVFAWATILSLFGFFGAGFIDARHRPLENFGLECIMIFCLAAFTLALSGLILAIVPRTRPWMSWVLRRWLFCVAALATLVGLFYAEENWRGERAFERSKRELAAKGVVLDWDKFIPPAVPDDQNVFKAPKMQEWFVHAVESGKKLRRISSGGELTTLLQSPTNFPYWGETRTIDSETDARAYLVWSDGLEPQFNLLREALKRPYSRMDGDYSNMLVVPFPNVVALRAVARVMAQRVHCHLLLHEPEKAIQDIALIHDLSHLLDGKPTGKPITLVAGMINVADAGLYADVVGKGLQTHAWQEPQLVELQKQLSDTHVLALLTAAFESEPAASARAIASMPIQDIANVFDKNFLRLAPRGWILQNIANEAPFFYAPVEAINVEKEIVSPGPCKEGMKRLTEFVSHKSPYTFLAAEMIPNIFKAAQTTARNQNAINEALVACAIERYHLARSEYPQSLDALAPDFLKTLPHDIINGGPLKYHRSEKGFVLYSIGWNEIDEGGMVALTKDGKPDTNNGDWVWQYSMN
jgi:hypothetical protein